MEQEEIEDLVDNRLRSVMAEHKQSMPADMERLFDKISGHSNLEQIDKISSILTGLPKFKRKSNEFQFQHNAKVNTVLETTDQLLQNNKIDEARTKIAEGKEIIAYRQKLIKMADSSDLGWKMVEECESNPLADGSDDEKKMNRAAREAGRKQREERAKKKMFKRYRPYMKRPPTSAMVGPYVRYHNNYRLFEDHRVCASCAAKPVTGKDLQSVL